MEATFHLCGDLDVQIRTDQPARGVTVSLSNPMAEVGLAGTGAGSTDTWAAHSLTLSKSVARAVASALMGAAADL